MSRAIQSILALALLFTGMSAVAEEASTSAKEAVKDPVADEQPVVRLETTLGNIDIELDPKRAPESVENFLTLVDNGFYEGLVFHRVVAWFVIQAGGYDATLA